MPVKITLPDGFVREYDGTVDGARIAGDISNSLRKAAIAIAVKRGAEEELRDLSHVIDSDAHVRIITAKDEEGLEIIRHDTAHIMAQAVQELFDDVQVTIGPAIKDGFYYDFARDTSFTPQDLEVIEKRMEEIVSRADPIIREEWDRDEAIAFFRNKGEEYKAELISDIPKGEIISLYRHGEFIDLCRGPHAPSTAFPKAFKLTKLAGAYWRGDSNNAMLQRIYGTAWADKKALQAHLTRLEEAAKRDHRKIGKETGLFHFQEEAAGQVFWHDKGWTLYRTLEQYIRDKIRANGYTEVKTPMLLDRSFWEKSGHWDKFRENMFIAESENRHLAVKPMNCPCHVQIYNQGITSYKDLPIRMAEFGSCHRNEASGALYGLMRVRAMVQDDAHIFCTQDQIVSETKAFCDLLHEVYTELGFTDVAVKLATRPDKRAGSDETWDRAEAALENAMQAACLEYDIEPGEGAFYGPKIEFHLTDAIGRSWQCGTLQLDFVLPERLDANYIGSDGAKHRPVMLHRAILGSLERFLGILIEHYEGKFPLWLAPLQVVVATVTDAASDYAQDVAKELGAHGIRAKTDLRSDKIGYKVREHSLQKVPVIFAVGARETEERTVAIRRLGSKSQEVLALDDAIATLKEEVAAKSLTK